MNQMEIGWEQVFEEESVSSGTRPPWCLDEKAGTSRWPNSLSLPKQQSIIYLVVTANALRHGVSSGVALTEIHEAVERNDNSTRNEQSKYCSWNDHEGKAMHSAHLCLITLTSC